MKNILLIGGAGYVGTVVSSYFLKKGYKVTVLDNFVYSNQFSVMPYVGDPDYTLIHGNMGDNIALEIASKGITDVIILSGLVGDPITKKYPEESKLINEVAVRNCIDFFNDKGIEKLVFISTCSNYGLIKDNELADENFVLNPLSLYAKAKVSNEQYLMSKKDSVDYSGVVLRFATAFGLSPRMRFDLSISEFVRDMFFGKELDVFDKDTWRPYCHVRDFARLLDIVINAKKEKVDFEIFNAGGDVNNSTKQMLIDEILNYIPNAKVKFTENGSDPRNYRVTFEKVKNELGFIPQFTIKDGIKELVDALNLGLYKDSANNKSKYGNFTINYTK